MIASGWVSQGPRVREFEPAFAERVGAAEAVAMTNCTRPSSSRSTSRASARATR